MEGQMPITEFSDPVKIVEVKELNDAFGEMWDQYWWLSTGSETATFMRRRHGKPAAGDMMSVKMYYAKGEDPSKSNGPIAALKINGKLLFEYTEQALVEIEKWNAQAWMFPTNEESGDELWAKRQKEIMEEAKAYGHH